MQLYGVRPEDKADTTSSYNQYLITGYSPSTQPKNKGQS